MPVEDFPPLLVLAGPTATGKSEVALALCADGAGEIISADSAVVYRGLDIGTDKPTAAALGAVPHHLLNVRDPRASFSLADYRELADQAIRACGARGRLPVLVGGTGLYIRSVLEGGALPPVPAQPDLRAALARQPAASLHARLAAADPAAAARIHPANVRRVIRALEVLAVTGRPISAVWADSAGQRRPARVFVLDRPQSILRERIGARVARMLAMGLVAEVKGLLREGVAVDAQSLQALGYRQTVRWLATGGTERDLAEAIVTATAQYAKRQRTWFRRETGALWIDLGAGPAGDALPEIRRLWGADRLR